MIKVYACISQYTLESLGKSLETGNLGLFHEKSITWRLSFISHRGFTLKSIPNKMAATDLATDLSGQSRSFKGFKVSTTGLHLNWKVLLNHLLLSKLTFLGV